MILKILFILVFLISCSKGHLFNALSGATTKSLEFGSLESGYSWPDSRYNFNLVFNHAPQVGINSKFEIKFWDSYQYDQQGPYTYVSDTLCVFLWMKMPSGSEHGSSPVTISKAIDGYTVDDVYFIMPGEWSIHIRTIDTDGSCSKDSAYLKESVVQVNL